MWVGGGQHTMTPRPHSSPAAPNHSPSFATNTNNTDDNLLPQARPSPPQSWSPRLQTFGSSLRRWGRDLGWQPSPVIPGIGGPRWALYWGQGRAEEGGRGVSHHLSIH